MEKELILAMESATQCIKDLKEKLDYWEKANDRLQATNEQLQESYNKLAASFTDKVFEPSLALSEEAVGFGRWLGSEECPYVSVIGGNLQGWVHSIEQEIFVNGSEWHKQNLVINHSITTAELYSLYKQSLNQTKTK